MQYHKVLVNEMERGGPTEGVPTSDCYYVLNGGGSRAGRAVAILRHAVESQRR